MISSNPEVHRNLLDAVIQNDKNEVGRLLSVGADPNFYEDDALLRPLHFAALYNAHEVVALLVMSGADVAAFADNGDVPIEIARRHGHDEVVMLLTKYVVSRRVTATEDDIFH